MGARMREWGLNMAAAAMLPLVAFVLIPVAFYVANQKDLEYNTQLLSQCGVLFAGSLVVLALLFRLVRAELRPRVAVLLFFLGLYAAISDMVLPVRMGVLDGKVALSRLPEPWTRDVAEWALLVGALVFGASLPAVPVRRVAALIAGVLVLTQVSTVWRGMRAANRQQDRENSRIAPPAEVGPQGNVYQIVLDGFSGWDFEHRLRQTKAEPDLSGFVWFSRHRANYLLTEASLPSLMTGTRYTNGSMHDWMWMCRQQGILKEARQAGYTVWQFLPSRHWVHSSASYVERPDGLVASGPGATRQFWALVGLHLAPHWLHQEVHAKIFQVSDRTAVRAANMLRRLTADEKHRPATGQYVFVHVLIPHPPYLLNKNAEFAPDVGYADQAEGCITLLRDFLVELRRLGRYDDATIMVLSDHGDNEVGPATLEEHGASAQTLAQIAALPPTAYEYDYTPLEKFNRSHALLLVKPPHSKTPFRIDSERLTQNLDVAATIYDLSGIPAQAPLGTSAFGDMPAGTTEVHFFHGPFFETTKWETDQIEHYVYRSDGVLSVAESLPVFW